MLGKLIPNELSPNAFNAQYLQHHPSHGDAILAAAKVSRMLGASREEIESALFNAVNANVEISLEVSPRIS